MQKVYIFIDDETLTSEDIEELNLPNEQEI